MSPEETLSYERQKAALYNLKQDEWIKSLYGMEVDTSLNHFYIIYEPGYTDDEKMAFQMQQENDLMVICGFLKQPLPSKQINMYVSPTKEKKQLADPQHSISRASFRSTNFTIYRVWDKSKEMASYPHETVHAITHLWANPYSFPVQLDAADGEVISVVIPMVSTSFMQEGLAIAVDELAFGRKLREGERMLWADEYMVNLIKKGSTLPYLGELMLFEGFCAHPNDIAVPMAVSWTKHLLATHGLEVYKKLYIELGELQSKEQIEHKVKEILGVSLMSSQANWVASLSAAAIGK
jgi:hypothetical protein